MTDTTTIDLLCQRMIEDMTARKLGPASQKSRLRAYKRFAAWLQRSPDTATADDIRLFQLHLAETGVGTVTRNATMTGLRFLFRVTLRRHDHAFEIYHTKEPQKVPLILNQDEAARRGRSWAWEPRRMLCCRLRRRMGRERRGGF
jgi:integrase/recombinase XerD